MPLPQPNREQHDGKVAASASDAMSRTLVPNQTEETVMEEQAFPEVTAQRATAAFDAVEEVLEVVLRRADDLSFLPAGRELVARARTVASRHAAGRQSPSLMDSLTNLA